MDFKFSLFHRFIFLAALIGIISFCGCSNTQAPADNSALKAQYRTVDSLVVAGKGDSAVVILNALGAKTGHSNPLITQYYYLKALYFRFDPPQMELYADSALAFFDEPDRARKYGQSYLQALLLKGDVCMLDRRYNQALRYYDMARKVIADGNCDGGQLAIKMAGLYFAQKNYGLAAKYWAQNFKQIGTCDATLTRQKLFFMRQAALNNAGFAFEKSGQLDSATSYYQQDLQLIQKADKDKTLNKYYINTSSIVVYDNLGGLDIKRGHYADAFKNLNKCISFPTVDVDGMRITPYLKLADLNMRTGNYPGAAAAFAKSKQLLSLYWKGNPESNLNWNKLYAAYLFKTNQPAEAYRYLNTYIRLNDSLQVSSSKLARLDIDQELNSLRQQQKLTDLEQNDKIKLVYLVAISVAALLLIAIIVLVVQNLKRSRKNHQNTVLQNQKLTQTLADLESANKNYIRMMRVMAHDLRNPLGGITGLATMILEEEDTITEDNRYALTLIESTGSNTLDMINELLRSGLDDDSESAVTEEVDLKKILFDSVELLRFKAKEKNQEIVFMAADEPVMAGVNVEKMWRAFNNLIVNAIKFSFADGVITVGIVKIDGLIRISVADNGVGIPDKNKDSIFEMFTPSKRQGTGGEQPFGLGLSITKKIIEKHGGKIWFTSEEGKGTVFYLELGK